MINRLLAISGKPHSFGIFDFRKDPGLEKSIRKRYNISF
jgi:hypothetical protein